MPGSELELFHVIPKPLEFAVAVAAGAGCDKLLSCCTNDWTSACLSSLLTSLVTGEASAAVGGCCERMIVCVMSDVLHAVFALI